MTSILEMALGALAALLLVAVFAAGLHSGSNIKAEHCDDFGKFKHKDVFYECKRVMK